jgi:hypothetical protein
MGVTDRECIQELLPPEHIAESRFMSLLFPNSRELSEEDNALLADAYELACDELVEDYAYSPQQLATALEPMAVALLVLFKAGQRDRELLGRYSASKALHHERIRMVG